MDRQASSAEWRALAEWRWIPTLAILMGGVLLQSTNALLLATVLPSIADEFDSAAMLSLPAVAYVGSAIVAASGSGLLTTRWGARTMLSLGVAIFGVGALICSAAASMQWVIAGRIVQGFGGGLEVGAAYGAVRIVFPERLWPRVIALLATSWTVSVLVGPLIGGLFANAGHWRGAFILTTVAAVVLAVAATYILPAARPAQRADPGQLPAVRIGLIGLAIVVMSSASLVGGVPVKAGLVVAALAILALTLRLDRRSPARLLPGDAFSFASQTGAGLWLALLLCIAFSPLQIYVPIFLQKLHGLDPLQSGFTVAAGSLAWTLAAIGASGATGAWPARLLLCGPLLMAASLAALAWLLPSDAPAFALIPAIAVLGVGIGLCWPFVGPLIMSGARPGDEAVAASAVPTIQQAGFALGAALAGVAANASGFSPTMDAADFGRPAFWVPACFVTAAGLAWLAGLRLYLRSRTARAQVSVQD